MEASQEFLDRLISSPSESLNVEVKRWIDPQSNHGCAKIAIGCMALRNRNGGYFIIGFDDQTLQPDLANRPDFVGEIFHTDIVQAIVSRYSSVPFEVTVALGARPEGQFPIIVVGSGVTVPVAAKRQLADGSKQLIRQDAVYFRTLNANGVPSSSSANYSDWQDIVEICFENREADIGRFLRRHLGAGMAERFVELTTQASGLNQLKQRAFELLAANDARRRQVFTEPEFIELANQIAKNGSWKTMLVFDPHLPNDDSSEAFLNTVAGSNPQYTGWPVWLDSRNFHNEQSRPRKSDKGWDTIVLDPGTHGDRMPIFTAFMPAVNSICGELTKTI